MTIEVVSVSPDLIYQFSIDNEPIEVNAKDRLNLEEITNRAKQKYLDNKEKKSNIGSM